MSPELKNRIAQLQLIRRKVDKATKRADAMQTECSLLWQAFNASYAPGSRGFPEAFAKLCDKTRFLVHDMHDGYSVVYRGEYSLIFPGGVGPTVAEFVPPHTVAVDAWDASIVASCGVGATA